MKELHRDASQQFNNISAISNNISNNTILRHPDISQDQPEPPTHGEAPPSLESEASEQLGGLAQNGEGVRKHQVQKDVLKPLRNSFSNRSDFPPTQGKFPPRYRPTQLRNNKVTPGTVMDQKRIPQRQEVSRSRENGTS